MQTVITYRCAYISRTLDLCARHQTDEAAGMPLGPVEHGQHEGLCVVCEAPSPADLLSQAAEAEMIRREALAFYG